MKSGASPTNKVAAVGGTGVFITLILQLMAQYFPSVHMPDAATLSMILTVIITAAGWITREAPAIIHFVDPGKPLPHPDPPAPLISPVVSPTQASQSGSQTQPLNDWGKV